MEPQDTDKIVDISRALQMALSCARHVRLAHELATILRSSGESTKADRKLATAQSWAGDVAYWLGVSVRIAENSKTISHGVWERACLLVQHVTLSIMTGEI